ncbi:MAG: M28 family peptidase [Candidatus Lokiarchaeia archaeon]
MIPVSFMRYVAFTPPEGITAEMVYVGKGTADEFQAVNSSVGIEGKIVMADILASGIPHALVAPFSLFTHDPNDTLTGDKILENFPDNNLASSYRLAEGYGAVGFIGVITFHAKKVNQYFHMRGGVYLDGSIPGLFVSLDDSDYLKGLLQDGNVEATMVLTGYEGQGVTYNVYGFLPGQSDEIIVISTHHDGWATNEGSGAAVVMALAKYLAQFPQESRERTLMFLASANHFNKDRPNLFDQHQLLAELKDQVVLDITIESPAAKQIKVIDGEYVKTDLVAARLFFVSGPLSGTNPLLEYAIDAVQNYDLDRTTILHSKLPFGAPLGEGGRFYAEGMSTVAINAHNAPQATNWDKPNTVAVDQLRPVTAALADFIMSVDGLPTEFLTLQ